MRGAGSAPGSPLAPAPPTCQHAAPDELRAQAVGQQEVHDGQVLLLDDNRLRSKRGTVRLAGTEGAQG